MVNGVGSWVLAAVPMFIFAADILTKGHTANRLLDVVDAFTRHLRGGLPITTAMSCAVFGAVSGSTQATVVAMGGPMRPRLLGKGYSDSFALALIINASDIALLIPPSIGFIVYGVVMKTSIGDLFLAGIIPGLLVLLMFSVYCWIGARVKGIEPEERASWGVRFKAMRGAILPLGFPILVVGGIYGGLFSAVEASAIAVAYALAVGSGDFPQGQREGPGGAGAVLRDDHRGGLYPGGHWCGVFPYPGYCRDSREAAGAGD